MERLRMKKKLPELVNQVTNLVKYFKNSEGEEGGKFNDLDLGDILIIMDEYFNELPDPKGLKDRLKIHNASKVFKGICVILYEQFEIALNKGRRLETHYEEVYKLNSALYQKIYEMITRSPSMHVNAFLNGLINTSFDSGQQWSKLLMSKASSRAVSFRLGKSRLEPLPIDGGFKEAEEDEFDNAMLLLHEILGESINSESESSDLLMSAASSRSLSFGERSSLLLSPPRDESVDLLPMIVSSHFWNLPDDEEIHQGQPKSVDKPDDADMCQKWPEDLPPSIISDEHPFLIENEETFLETYMPLALSPTEDSSLDIYLNPLEVQTQEVGDKEVMLKPKKPRRRIKSKEEFENACGLLPPLTLKWIGKKLQSNERYGRVSSLLKALDHAASDEDDDVDDNEQEFFIKHIRRIVQLKVDNTPVEDDYLVRINDDESLNWSESTMERLSPIQNINKRPSTETRPVLVRQPENVHQRMPVTASDDYQMSSTMGISSVQMTKRNKMMFVKEGAMVFGNQSLVIKKRQITSDEQAASSSVINESVLEIISTRRSSSEISAPILRPLQNVQDTTRESVQEIHEALSDICIRPTVPIQKTESLCPENISRMTAYSAGYDTCKQGIMNTIRQLWLRQPIITLSDLFPKENNSRLVAARIFKYLMVLWREKEIKITQTSPDPDDIFITGPD